jgi:erythromycin esterase
MNGACLASLTILAMLLGGGRDGDPDKVEALIDVAVEVRTSSFTDTDYSDLIPLEEAIGDARVVALGEISHIDGATLVTRNRLIRFLHEEMHFDVLAWEAGMVGCRRMSEMLRAQEPLAKAKAQMMNYQWPASELMQPLFEYARDAATTQHPLEMAGFDNEHGARGAELLTEMLERVLDLELSPRPKTEDVERVRALLPRAVMRQDPIAVAELERLAQRESLRGLLAVADQVQGRSAEASFALEALRAALVFEDVIHLRDQSLRSHDFETLFALGKARDEEMARLLIWQAEHRFPDRKILLIGANDHFARAEEGIPRLRAPMGSFLDAHFGPRLYAIAFTAWGGELGTIFPDGDSRKSMTFPLEAPPADSFEDLCHRTTLPLAFVDLSHLPTGHWLGRTFVARPLGFAHDRVAWGKVFNAFFFIDTMFPDRVMRSP